MTATVLDARPVASRLRRQLVDDLLLIRKEAKVDPGLGLLLVTGEQVVMAFADKLAKAAEELGVAVTFVRVADRNIDAQFFQKLQQLVADPAIRGIHIATTSFERPDLDAIFAAMPLQYDISGLHYANVGHLAIGRSHVLPPRVAAILELLEEYVEDYRKRSFVLVSSRNDGARGFLARSFALHLAEMNIPVTIRPPLAHTGGAAKDGQVYNPGGEILVTIANTMGAVTKHNVARGSIVIDAGANFHLGRVSGDANFQEVAPLVSVISPMPGGVDALSPLCALRNMLTLVKRELRWEMAEGEQRGLRARRRL